MSNFEFAPACTFVPCIHQGKVRDTFSIPDRPDMLLTVATNRVSTHNIVHDSEVPKKGSVLTAMTVFWMRDALFDTPSHLISYGDQIWDYLPDTARSHDLQSRGLIILKLKMIPVEFIFRSNMAGSLWKDYYSKGLDNPYGINLPSGMNLMSSFGDTVFTPTDKSETDEPQNAQAVIDEYPEAYQLALQAYEQGRILAGLKGITIIDGKFEVGIDPNGNVVLADECLTPDSCRFVNSNDIKVGQEPTWLDKQFLREEAERIWAGGKKHPVTFAEGVTNETTRRYKDIFRQLTDSSLEEFQQDLR